MNTEVTQAARDAEQLIWDAGSFQEAEGLDYTVEAYWIEIKVGHSATIRMSAEDAAYARLDLVNDRGVCYATQQLSGSAVALAYMVAQAINTLSDVAETIGI